MTRIEPRFYLNHGLAAHPMSDVDVLAVAYACSCGWQTPSADLRDNGGNAAHQAMREHLVDHHPDETPAGRCSRCNVITDHFRARVAQLHTDLWLCERHAPKMPTVLDQAEEVPHAEPEPV